MYHQLIHNISFFSLSLFSLVYVILGYYFEHLGLMMSLQNKGLLDKGEYFVVGIDIEQYETQDPTRYLKGKKN